MKQSTFSAVMANSIKNLLQGYTKGIRFTAILTLLFTIGVGQMWGADVTYTVTSTTAVSTSGTAPTGSSASYTQTYSTAGQITSGKYATLTLTNLGGINISNITLSMKSNKSSGAGKLSYSTDGGSTWTYLVGSSGSGLAFNNASWNGSYTQTYTDIFKTVNLSNVTKLTIKIEATTNSLYCQSYKITYTTPGTKVTLTKGSVTNGSIDLNKSEVITTSAAQSITVTCTPNTGYYTKSVSATKPATGNTPTYGGSGDSRTVTYSKGSNGSSTITATFSPQWQLRGTFNNWGTTHPLTSFSGNIATVTVDLQAMTEYTFKFVNVSGSSEQWYGNTGAIITDISNWEFSTSIGDNARLYTGPAGTYTFKFNVSTKALQVIYPTVTHPAEGYAYFQKQDSWNGFKVYNYTSDDNRLSDWNGSPSVTNTTTICGKTYYYTALATQFQKVIFRDNGSNQWKEINVSGYSGKYCGDDYNANPQTWKAFNKYSITFNSNGGSGTMSTISGICPGDNQALPANTFTRTGYTFDGWATSANGNKAYNDKATISNINSNITLYARWKANIYTITSNLTNCSSSPEIPTSYTYTGSAANLTYTITPESGYRLPDAITVSGCTYTWNKTTGQLELTGMISGNVTITIKAVKVYNITWKVNKQTYTTGGPTTSVDEGSTYKNLTLPTPPANNTLDECYPGKKFVGWSTTNIGSTESSEPAILFKTAAEAPNTAITENKTLYAVFATETGGGTTTTSESTTLDFSAQGYENQATITSLTIGDITAAFSKGSNSNAPKYYTSGTAVRVYGGGYFTVSGAIGCTITKVVITFGSDDGSNAITTNAGTYSNGTWTGSASSVKFTVGGTSGNRRIQSLAVTYSKTTDASPTYSNYVTECCTLNNINLDNSGTTTGGTFSATASKACEGEEITLSATAAECYAFVSWTIKKTSDGSDVTNSVLDGNTLTMPDYAVTVYATFKSLSVTEIALSMTGGHKNLDVGETNQLLVTYKPADATCDKAIVSWTSSDDNVMSVTDGLVEALRAGTATITATTEGGVTATYTITVNNPTCDSWYIHYWNNSTSGDECFYKVKPDDPNDHEWRTNNFSLPSFSNEDMFIVNNAQAAGGDSQKTDQIFRTGIGFADIQRGEQSCGTNPYPGQDAYGQLSIYDDSNSPNRYIAFYPAQYLVTYGKEGAAPWEVLPLNNTTGYEYETEPFMVPNGYKTDDAYKYYVGITDKNGNIKYVGYEFGGVEYKKSSVDPMNTVNGLSADDMAGKWGTWHIYSNSCANNWYCEFIHYYRVDFNLNGGEGDFAPRYGKATTPYVEFTTTDIGAPTRTGYTFLGWKDQNNKIYAPTDATVTINNDLTLTALWVEEYGSDNCRWEEVTIDDIEYGDEVVVVMVYGETLYALPYDSKTASNSNPEATTITTDYFAGTVDETLIWYIMKGDGNTFTLSPKTAINKYLTCNSSNNAVRIDTDLERYFTIENGFLYNTTYNTYLAISTTATPPDWRHFTSTNATIANKYQTLKLYKKVCLPEGHYRVTWDANGGQWSDGSTTKEEVYAEGATINKPDKPKRDGYEFTEWAPNPTTMPDKNTTFTAQWAELHTITWMVGSSSVLTEDVANGTGVTQTPDDPANNAIGNCANAFMGWSESNLGSAEGQSAPADLCTAAQMKSKHTSVTGDKTFYAVFASAEGEDIDYSNVHTSNATISAGSRCTASKVIIDEQKYDAMKAGTSSYSGYIEITVPAGTTNLYFKMAGWNGKGGKTITLSGATADPTTFKTIADAGINGTGTEYTLEGNIADYSYSVTLEGITAQTTLVFSNSAKEQQFVIWGANAASITYSNYVTQCCTDWTPTLTYSKTTLDSETHETATPTITGNTHSAPVSFESSNESVLKVDANNGTITAVGAGKATITATWAATGEYCDKSITTDEITVNGNFLVTFHANDGSGNTTTQQIPSNTATALKANTFQRDGYTFQGWAISASGAKVYDDRQEVTLSTSGLDLYAVWQVKAYEITIGTVTGNGTITTSPANSANCDAQVTITATPAAHYTLASVTVTRDDNSQTVAVVDNKFTMPASDVTITAEFTENEKFAINYDIPTGGGTLTDNAPTFIYIDGSITLPGIKDGTISSEYSCEQFIGWTTNPADYEAAGLKPEPFYNTGASFSDVSDDVTFYPVYSRPGAGVGGTVTLTAEEMEGWSVQQSYGTLRELVTCHGTWKTTGVKSTGNPIQLRATDNPYVEFPELQGNITQVVLNATNGSNATLTFGTFTLKTLDGQTTIASASVNNSGVCTLTVTSSYKTARLYSSVTARIANISISYGPPAIISTTLDCSSDVDECTITYDLNESFLAAGTQVLGSCHNSTFKFSEVGTYTICSEPQANEYKLIGWNNQCDGKGSLTYTPGQVISSLPQNIITLYAQWVPEVIVHDSYEETKVYPTAMGGSITLNSGQYACDPKKYDFIGWTTEDPQLWQQNTTPPTLLTDNGDGTVTFTPEEPSQVYAVYAIEDLANSDAFKLSSIVEGIKYYAKYNAYKTGHMIATTEVAEALTFGKEQSTGSTYKIFFVNPNGEKEYIYSNGDLQTSSAPLETWAWTISGTAGNYTFTSAYGDGKCLSTNGNNFGVVLPENLSVVFDMEVSAEYKYIAKTNCSENVTITFVPGNGSMTPSTNPVTAKTGDVINLPTCTYEGWTFLGWVTENIELTEFEIDPTRLYNGHYEVGNSDITLYAYYTQIPESAEFDGTTSEVYKMYCEVDDKYYYAISHGSSSPGTLPSSNICLNAEEWVFTNTGEANVYYIQDHNNLYLTPEINNTQLFFTSTPFPWKVVEIGTTNTYRIYAYNTRNDDYSRLIMFMSSAFYHSAKINEGNSAWHHVTIGGCQNPVYTTDPQPSKIISLVGSPMITSTIGQTVKASQKLQLVIKDMDANADVTITADGLTFYDTDNNVVNNLQTGSNGSLTATFTVAYTPSVADNQIVKPTITITCGSTVRTFYNVSCRSLPATFAIVAKVGNLWYALPSQGLNSTTPPAAYPVEVDDMADPTAVIAVPENADWSLRQVYASSGSNDRFTANGDNLVFVNNASPAMTLNASSSEEEKYLLTDAQYANYYKTNPGLYEWTPTTTDLETYQLTNEQRSRTLSVNTATVFGVHAQDKAVEQVRFLPITGRYTPAALQVVEWKENSVVIMYNGDPAQTAFVSVNGGKAQETVLSSAQRDIAVYELTADGLAANPTQRLSITIGTEKVILPIPYIINSVTTDLALLPQDATVAARQDIAKVSDLVILKGATLTADGAKGNPYKFRNVTIYGGGKLVIPSEKGFGVSSLTMRLGTVNDDGSYTNSYPQLVLNGTINTGNINVDYLTTYDRYYALSLPYEVNTTSILYPADIYGDNLKDGGNQASFALQYYDGDARATGASGWKDFDESGDDPTLTRYKGYTFWGAPRKVKVNGATKGTRQKYGIHRIPITETASDLMKGEKSLDNNGNVVTRTIDINAYDAESTYDMGWNFIGNPFLAAYGKMQDEDAPLELGMLVMGESGWERQGTIRYITTTEDGKYYIQTPVTDVTLYPFNTFFVQAAQEGAISFNVSNRLSLPARQLIAEQQAAKEITTGIILTGNDQTDRTGLLIADNFTEEYDFNADLSKFENSGINLYTIGKDGKLAFMAINQALAEQPIPLGYGAPADGEYTIAFDEDRYNATDISALYLIDYDSNEKTNLLHTDYSFVTAAGTNNQRFALQVAFIPQNATSVEWVDDATIQVAVDGNNLLLNNLPTDAGVQVFDALGRVIYATPNAPTEMQITLPTGYYLVRIADKQHAVVINTIIP